MKKLYIAEKPSVAQEFAKALKIRAARKDGYLEGEEAVVTWCVGHLVTMSYPEIYDASYKKWSLATLPFLPENFLYEVIPATKKQFKVVSTLLNRKDIDVIYVCTDSGREGEYIYRLVEQEAHVQGKKRLRVWIDSQTEEEILHGIATAKDLSAYDNLASAAYLRAKEDYLMGINFSRLLSLKYGQSISSCMGTRYTVISVGRVMTCVLGMIVRREREIRQFVKMPFYRVLSSMVCGESTIEGEFRAVKGSAYFQSPKLYKENGFSHKEDAKELIEKLSDPKPVQAVIEKLERKKENKNPPLLYNLAELQNDCSKRYKISPDETLKIVQELYEKKLVTYPRTDSRYLTSDMKDMLPELIKSLFNIFPVEDVKNVPVHVEQVINDKKVSDHHAIIPTKETLKFSLEELPKGEQAILRLIATRLFCAVGEPFRYNESVIELSDGNYIFSAKGKTIVQSGWKIFSGKPADKDKESEKQLPSLTVGEGLSVHSAEVKEGKTSPPKHFTEDTLLQSMETAGADEMPEDAERKGLGTPATRAATIEKLVRIGFLERKGDKKTKHLISTHKGTALVTVMPEQIQSPSMTADWEEKLLMIERGEYDSNAFLKEIQDMISALVQTYEKVKGSDVLMAKEVQTVGVCPVCGSSVTERQKGFFCSKRECHFALWKNSRYFESIGKSLTSAVAQKLLSNGEVKLKGCKSAKTGRMYDAIVVMTVTEEGKPQFNMNFENGGNSK